MAPSDHKLQQIISATLRGGVIVAVGFDSPYQSRVSTILRYAFLLSSIMSNNLLRSNFAFHNLAHHAAIIPVLPQFDGRIRLFDTDRVPEIIAAGEESNNLEKVLVDVTEGLEKRTNRQLDMFAKLLEPVMLLVMAVFVALIVAGLLLPVFQMSNAAK